MGYALLLLVASTVAVGAGLPSGCPGDGLEERLLAHESDCGKFYQCVHGRPVLVHCPGGTWFDVSAQECDWPENVKCTNGDGDDGDEDGDIGSGESEIESGESDVESEVDIDSGEGDTGSGESDIGSGVDNGVDLLPNGCPADFSHRLLPHETECIKFYYCVWGEKVERECSPGTLFNPSLQVCDWPANVECTSSGGGDSGDGGSDNGNGGGDDAGEEGDNGSGGGDIGSGEGDDGSGGADNGSGQGDEGSGEADNGSGGGGEGNNESSSTTKVPTTTTAKAPSETSTQAPSTTESVITTPKVVTEPEEDETKETDTPSATTVLEPENLVTPSPPAMTCPVGVIGNVPHPSLCDSFYVCLGGNAMQMYCSSGFEFNPETRQCVPISDTGCFATNGRL